MVEDMVTFRIDGGKRVGIPTQWIGESQLLPLRFVQDINGFVGIQPLAVVEKSKKVAINVVQFPATWNFAVR